MLRSLMNLDFQSVIIYILAVVLAMSVHEMAHGLVSYLFGDPTAKRSGRLSLNPFAHIDWTGLACLLLFGFGWAKPVPVDPRYYKDPKTGMIWTAFAGPVANFLLAFVCLLIYFAMVSFGLSANAVTLFIANLMIVTANLSVGFGIFNLIPVPPLDGAKIFWAFLPDREYYQFNQGKPWMTLLFLVLIGSGLLSQPLSIMRGTMMDWLMQAAAWIFHVV